MRVVEDDERKKVITEDDKFKLKDDIQKLTEKYEKQIDEILPLTPERFVGWEHLKKGLFESGKKTRSD